jgi:hypothetical protein
MGSFTSLDSFKIFKDAYGKTNREFVKDPVGTDTVLRLRYPAGSFKPSSVPVGGTGFYAMPIDLSTAKTVAFTYKIFFPTGFNFVKGGKLPGLIGGRPSCSGGDPAKDCFSTRYMVRKYLTLSLAIYILQL